MVSVKHTGNAIIPVSKQSKMHQAFDFPNSGDKILDCRE